ncbi:hypothetical protein DQ04_12511000 [Trypanosoma grayi]|uniref:hypothetical protein n=1 Tax=Trypanosoma grayi TaxID=71804 RepID=UPI0004F43811|nr:hypothetical protein DQ04_12511000 [Trypanosoma grayi]KEG06737.1 hypothetical protein DQ04_12511000 [Trypanosoma grayi]
MRLPHKQQHLSYGEGRQHLHNRRRVVRHGGIAAALPPHVVAEATDANIRPNRLRVLQQLQRLCARLVCPLLRRIAAVRLGRLGGMCPHHCLGLPLQVLHGVGQDVWRSLRALVRQQRPQRLALLQQRSGIRSRAAPRRRCRHSRRTPARL